MTTSRQKCYDSAHKQGAHSCYTYDSYDISDEFRQDNKAVLDQERGAGYWLWKPYFINRVMQTMEDNSYLIYSDAGVEFIAPVQEIISRMDEDIFFFTNGFPHVEWCKGDVLNEIIPYIYQDALNNKPITPNHYDYIPSKQVQASVIFFKVNQKTRDFVKEWLLYSQFPGFIDDSPSKLPNYPTFAEHRHDQAILTCLQIKYGYKLHWWPTQYSEHIRILGDNYPVIFNHHRKRNSEW